MTTGATESRPLVDVRADFPVLRRSFDGKRLVYLDSGASTQKPRQVIEAMERFYSTSYGTVHRGVYELGREATEMFEGARERIAAFVGWDPACSIYTRNATEAINLVAYSWGRENVGEGDEVLITEMEHHSNIVPWQLLCEETGARLRYLSVSDSGELSLDELDAVLAEGRVKFEAGTSAIAEAIGLGAAVDYLASVGMENVRAHERDLTLYGLERLAEVEGIHIFGPNDLDRRGGGISFAIDGMHPPDIAELCGPEAVCVRAGHHCAQPLMWLLGVAATARATFQVYNSREDVDGLVSALHGARKVFKL